MQRPAKRWILEAARVAEAEAASHRATAAQKQKQIAELEDIYGVSKTLVTVSGKVCRVHMCDTSIRLRAAASVSSGLWRRVSRDRDDLGPWLGLYAILDYS